MYLKIIQLIVKCWFKNCLKIQGVGHHLEVIHGMGLCPIISAHLTESGREGVLQTMSVKEFWLAKRAFSAIASALWNILPPEMRCAPILLAFHKGVKSWFCSLVGEGHKGPYNCGTGCCHERPLFAFINLD